ncbi:HCL560Cp [Eremothecium sinecaudum]|uniref:HCL560Cp n=1 Tax=Eremothecium sinecaudum TaxID=45286 RepID=A0A120K1Q5_9SACH|nr:HCL560Cp [Eremothecium sinecaudum]AMD19591.1 HCL560Cp [Eremothecium sinecaudum]
MTSTGDNALIKRLKRKLTTRKGLIGEYNYKFLFTPQIFSKVKNTQPFFAVDQDVPLVLGFILGLQHALAMLAGVITPPILISLSANFSSDSQQYLVGASLVVSGILSLIQITRIRIPFTQMYVGSGMLSVVGTSFCVLPLVQGILPMMYRTGYCPTGANGELLECTRGYGALIGTSTLCALWEIALSMVPPRYLRKLFPSVVTGSVLVTMGASLLKSGFQDILGGAGCIDGMCPFEGAPMAAPYGSPKFIGLAFSVYITIILCEKWGAPIMKSCSVIVGLLVGCIIAAACGYFDRSGIDSARVLSFPWVKTFEFKVYGPAVIPFLVVYTLLVMETLGDLNASMEVSKLELEGPVYESRLQGGVLGDGVNGLLAGLMTITPMSTFAQNNGVIAMTRCASRTVGYWACFLLIVMGVFTKFAAALVAIPKPVLGGMTSFLFTSVLVSGIKIITTISFTRRDRFILTASLFPGIGCVLIPDWFSHVFNYTGSNQALEGFLNAITLVMGSSYCLAGFIATILNLFLPQEFDDHDDDEHNVNPPRTIEINEIDMDAYVPQYNSFERQIDLNLKVKKENEEKYSA